MGWKTNLVVVDCVVEESVLLSVLGRESQVRSALLTGEDLFPSDDFVICNYKGCTLISDPDIANDFTSDYGNVEVLSKVDTLGGTRVVACVLHSVVNLAAFSLFENGSVARAYACAADDGVFIDEGEMLECEKSVYAEYEPKTLEDGSVVYCDEHDEYDQSSLGEEVVFELLATFLGKRPDMDDELFETDVYAYASRNKGFFSRLFGG